MKYRAEVDGLRAVAVLPVVLFHAGFPFFSGGFVGVDIFFVISGYLITSILIRELDAGNFSIANFYERRARRILPALFFVIAVCLPFAWAWLVPSDLKSFAKSLIAVTAFVSNILFWRTSGYFESASELQPMLHTWSLAVEEQYYVFFPLILLALWRFKQQTVASIIMLATLASFALSLVLVRTNPSAAFYLLPTRAWELLIGALAAFYLGAVNSSVGVPSLKGSSLGAAAGFIMVIASIFYLDETMPVPSYWTLIPTLGAALIIICSDGSNFVGKLLSTRPTVGLGLISYSAYLWHQPIIAFSKHRSVANLSAIFLSCLVLASFALAFFTWRYVERPFRNKEKISRASIVKFSLLGSTAMLAFGFAGVFSNGFESRVPAEQAAFLSHFENSVPNWHYYEAVQMHRAVGAECDFYDLAAYRSGNATRIPISSIDANCFTKNTSIEHSAFIWGDSHAQQLRPGLIHELPKNWQVFQVASSDCPAAISKFPNKANYCDYSNWFALERLKELRPDVVIIGQNLKHDPAKMIELANLLTMLNVRKVIFTGPTPHWTTELPKVIAHRFWPNIPRTTFAGLDPKVLKLDRELKDRFAGSTSIEYVSIVDEFCNKHGCTVYLGDDLVAGITSYDYGHLTPIASIKLARDKLVPAITTN